MSRWGHWRDDEIVDGGGLPLANHVDSLARALALTPEQRSLLVAELRNALVPALVLPRLGEKAVERVVALADALADLP